MDEHILEQLDEPSDWPKAADTSGTSSTSVVVDDLVESERALDELGAFALRFERCESAEIPARNFEQKFSMIDSNNDS